MKDGDIVATLSSTGRAYYEVGRFLMHWAYLEGSLDQLVAMIYRGVGGHKHTQEIPFSLEPKLKFLTRCFDRVPELASYRAQAKEIVDGVRALAEIRHLAAHGAALGLPDELGMMEFTRLVPVKPERTIQKLERKKLTLDQLHAYADVAVTATMQVQHLIYPIFTDLAKAKGQWSGEMKDKVSKTLGKIESLIAEPEDLPRK